MIHLNRGVATDFVVTLKEKQILSSPYFLFNFKNDTSKIDYYCIIADSSSFKDRYNKFTFTEGTDSPLVGQLILGQSGYYDYYIYEQTSATNLDPDLSTNIVESGKMRLFDASDNPSFSSYSPTPTTNFVYNPS